MTELLTSAQMRAIEQSAILSGAVTGLELMECAGRGVVDAIFKQWPELAQRPFRAVVLCGPGNNGGDGFVIARLLKAWGWAVDVFLYGDPQKLPVDAKANYDRWAVMGSIGDLSGRNSLANPTPPDVVIDAVFGTGLTRKVDGVLARVLQSLADLRAGLGVKVVAVDVPSGLCADSGHHLGAFATADLTVSFHRAKLGHVLNRGADQSGKTVVVDIGLDKRVAQNHGQGGGSTAVSDGDIVRLVDRAPKRLGKDGAWHKFTHGHALVLSGGMGRSGAARLAARGALRIGAGLVTVGAPGSAMIECAAQLTAIMLRRCDDADGLAGLLADDRLNALCLGPGLGVGENTCALVGVALSAGRSVILDADALTSFADAPKVLFDQLHDKSVMTPHAGEFARLFPDIAARLNAIPVIGPAYSKVDATREAAKRAGCVVLFKGADTVIAAPDGRCAVHSAHYDRAAPWLATAGSGDVLAGFITGLMARGLPAMAAAEMAAWLHVECARSFGPGLIAEDLPEQLPQVLREFGL